MTTDPTTIISLRRSPSASIRRELTRTKNLYPSRCRSTLKLTRSRPSSEQQTTPGRVC